MVIMVYYRITSHADLCENPHGKDHHPRGGSIGYDRKCKIENSG